MKRIIVLVYTHEVISTTDQSQLVGPFLYQISNLLPFISSGLKKPLPCVLEKTRVSFHISLQEKKVSSYRIEVKLSRLMLQHIIEFIMNKSQHKVPASVKCKGCRDKH